MSVTPTFLSGVRPPILGAAFARSLVGAGVAVAHIVVIMAVSLLAGAIYHEIAYQDVGPVDAFLQVGAASAAIFVLPGIIRGEYGFSSYYSFKPHARTAFTLWNVTFLGLLALGFLTKMTEIYSRGSMILFYAAGLPAIVLTRYVLVRTVMLGSRIGLVSAQRIFLVGTERDVAGFAKRYEPWNFGLQIVGHAILTSNAGHPPGVARDDMQSREIGQAIEAARAARPDAVFIVTPWSETATIDRCVEEFMTIPVEIHLSPERILDRFDQVRIAKLGPMSSLQLTRAPLSLLEVAEKRLFDVVVAGAGLLLLLPMLIAVGILIRLESPGPVFFLQRRYGFNQRPFRIIKFRTMTALDDGEHVPQAKRNDRRITRVGHWLRRTSIDELPQLINVLKGDMSLVGPRPHALAHNRDYEQRIWLYARRHNVRPGITGWAQVNGCRGETDSDEKMRRRVDHDLYYIDNWSMPFDLWILLLTAFSRRTYTNAV